MNLLRNKSILVVDDDAMLRESLCEIFKSEGANTTEASGGRDAFQLVSRGQFDVVFSDVRMPNGDGIELMERITRDILLKPVLFLCTGFSDITQAQLTAWNVRMIHKPFNVEELISQVAYALSNKRRT